MTVAAGRKMVANSQAKPKKAGSLAEEAATRSTSVASLLAEKLRAAIVRGDFPQGSSLPSERELMVRYQTSRQTVREALGALTAQELVVTKRGRSGGAYISSPTSTFVARSLNDFISGQNIRYIDLIYVREALEPAAAAQAALFRTEEQLQELEQLTEECANAVADFEAFQEANIKWHLALTAASNNPLFVAFLTSISTGLHEATSFEEFDLKIRKAVVGVHWQIYEAVRLRDADAARRRMVRHLSAYSEELASLTSQA
jgi:GntR family transcriptional repressor for pyruvate dehydrogenase complex